MKVKTGRKLGFITALAMLMGTVIGIGIFLKNHSILKANDWSGIGTLVSWIIGGILALAAAISFSEMSSLKSGKTVGLSDWAEKVGGRKFGYFIRFNFSFFYWGLLLIVVALFASETLIGIFTGILNKPMPHMGIVALVAVIILIFILTVNYLSIRIFGLTQLFCTILKFIPLALVAILGIALASTNYSPSSNAFFGQNAFSNGQPFDFTKVLAALPAVLFSYDAFLTSSAIRNKMKKEEQLPLVIALGMIITIVLYVLIAIAAILHGSGMVSGQIMGADPAAGLGIFDQIFKPEVAQAMGIFIIVFLFIATYGVTNGVAMAYINSVVLATKVGTFFGSQRFKRRWGHKVEIMYMIIFVTFFGALVFLPAIFMNNDAFVDAFSNFPTLFFFAVYAITIALYTLKRKNLTNKKINNFWFYTFATIAIGGIGFVFAYQLFYGMSISLLIDPNANTSLGLFAADISRDGYFNFNNLSLLLCFGTALLIFFGAPYLNAYLIKKFEKRDPYCSTQ